MDIRANVEAVRRRMEAAALAAGRRPEEITLCAATKVQTSDTSPGGHRRRRDGVRGKTGCRSWPSIWRSNAYAGARVHFIGHLQRNKVKQVVGRVALIESVDSPELLELIARRARELGVVQDVLLEVNIGGEASKSGIPPEETGRAGPTGGGAGGRTAAGIDGHSSRRGRSRAEPALLRQNVSAFC